MTPTPFAFLILLALLGAVIAVICAAVEATATKHHRIANIVKYMGLILYALALFFAIPRG